MFRSYINAINLALTNENKNNLKAILKLNNILIITLNGNQLGGTNEDEQKLISIIEPLKQKIKDMQNTNLQINDLVESKKQLKDLIEFIHYVHKKLPDDNNIKTLSNQMVEINRIVTKYN
jgi:predicted RNA-binding protein with EMAP domain